MRKIAFTLFLFLFSAYSFAAELSSAQDELLEPDKAFAMSTRVVDANTLEASWKIAKGYYMYRDKFKFEIVSGGLSLNKAVYPKGKQKKDQFFGDIEIYQKQVAISLPITRTNNSAFTATLRITGQGCNDPVGVCYPPITKTVKFDLPAATTTKTISSLKDLNKALSPDNEIPDFLEPDQAFIVTSLVQDDGQTIIIDFKIAPDYYLYHDKIKIALKDAGGASLKKITLPKGKIKDDPYFGKTEIHTKSFQAQVLISGTAAETAMLKVEYQGCAEQGICYPPATKIFPVNAGTSAITGAVTGSGGDKTSDKNGMDSKTYILAILGAFVTGLLLTFTPCVLPMIPILSSIIVGQSGEQVSKFRGGMLASIYVMGTAATYTAAGIFAGRSGEQLQAYFQNVWAIGIFSTILALLALSMFGFYEIQMPSFITSRLHKHSEKTKGGSIAGVFFLGTISALIVGACVSPLLISALGIAIASKDPTLGGLIMFSMAMGMGVILIGLGFGAGYLLPKAGVWMDRVKHFFGVLLLGVAIYLLGILPEVPVLLLWAVLLIITSVYFGATQPLPESATGWRYFWKGFGIILLLWGILALIGGFSGNRDIMHPINLSGATVMSAGGVSAGMPRVATEGHIFEKVKTIAELDARLAEAKAQGKSVMLDYFATWCTDCVRMEKTTFADPRVRKIMTSRFIALQVDVTDPNNPDSKAIKKRFSVFGPPALLFFDAQGNEMKDMHFYGYKNPEDFLALLEKM